MSQPQVIAVSDSNLTPAEQKLSELLTDYRSASLDQEDDGESVAQQRIFIEKYLDFQESLSELQQAINALKELNVQKKPQSADNLALIEGYLHQLTEEFMHSYKQIQIANGVSV